MDSDHLRMQSSWNQRNQTNVSNMKITRYDFIEKHLSLTIVRVQKFKVTTRLQSKTKAESGFSDTKDYLL